MKEPAVDPQSYKAQTMNWPQNVYYAWVLYGAVSMSSAMYWIQRYYFKNWYSDTTEYLSKLPYTYSLYGIAETINRVTLIIMWTLTAIVWCLTPADSSESPHDNESDS